MITSRGRRVRCRPALVAAAATILAGCAAGRPAVIGPVSDAEGTASLLQNRTSLDGPLRIDFRWELNEAGQRVRGVGVARVEPPYKARLDLFLDNGETVISAALIEEELRLPPGAPAEILPPPNLMWGTLGVFRPHGGTRLLGADRLEGEATRLRYGDGNGTELHYQVAQGQLQVLEVLEGDHVVQRVEVDVQAAEDRYPVEATYRNLADFRELRLIRESLETAAPFDPDIWDPAG